jgi:serine protease Do
MRSTCPMRRLIASFLCLLGLLVLPGSATADPADIDAASRGVVRIIVIEEEGGELYPISHGTGFAVSPELIVTNAHVIAEARDDRTLSIGIVPSDGGDAIYGRMVAWSPENDLALLSTTSPMNLSPLTISGSDTSDAEGVTAVGFPMNVDRAQGLGNRELFMPQPPVKSRGFLSGRRPTRDFDTILHTAPVARGSSGGPLLDNCGRVVGVNSFGAESSGTDAEFYFAVSTSELLPFLRKAGVTPKTNGLPCKSLAELDAEERLRAEREMLASERLADADRLRQGQREELARRSAEFDVMASRENGMMLAILLLLGAIGAGYAAWLGRQAGDEKRVKIAGGAAGVALLLALVVWLGRPGFDSIEERVNDALATPESAEQGPSGVIAAPGAGELVCVVNVERSRITGGETADVPLTWTEDGCVNTRTQYGLMEGKWSRILVPSDEAVVSVNSYDPKTSQYRVERYLLGHDAMEGLREARAKYTAPACGADDAAVRKLGSDQAMIAAMLPASPNERLVYDCHKAE